MTACDPPAVAESLWTFKACALVVLMLDGDSGEKGVTGAAN